MFHFSYKANKGLYFKIIKINIVKITRIQYFFLRDCFLDNSIMNFNVEISSKNTTFEQFFNAFTNSTISPLLLSFMGHTRVFPNDHY